MSFGRLIKHKRELKGWSREELAQKLTDSNRWLKITPAYLEKLETDQISTTGAEVGSVIKQLLNITIEESLAAHEVGFEKMVAGKDRTIILELSGAKMLALRDLLANAETSKPVEELALKLRAALAKVGIALDGHEIREIPQGATIPPDTELYDGKFFPRWEDMLYDNMRPELA